MQGMNGGAAPFGQAQTAAPAGKVCPKCGAAVPDGAKFCPECGKKMGASACPKCGAELSAGAKFCPECGERV
ncbi:MAG TPA: zinc ribbon domain-containing protein, partial [Methanocorpusculum sp.]|nr:zinc ribbon domain-containing protein [Methanocorpusculum sp.]